MSRQTYVDSSEERLTEAQLDRIENCRENHERGCPCRAGGDPMPRPIYYRGQYVSEGTVPMWAAVDEVNLHDRVRRLIDRPEPYPSTREPETISHPVCADCEADNHAHRATRVGPYLICRCLQCDSLVIEVAD